MQLEYEIYLEECPSWGQGEGGGGIALFLELGPGVNTLAFQFASDPFMSLVAEMMQKAVTQHGVLTCVECLLCILSLPLTRAFT